MSAVDPSEIFTELMRFKPEGLSANAWAVQAGLSRTVWADMRRHGNPSRRTLERLLSVAGSTLAEFEALRIGLHPRSDYAADAALADSTRTWVHAPLPPLPLLACRPGGRWTAPEGEVEMTEVSRDAGREALPRPASLAFDADAFALTIVNEAMWPRFGKGRRVAVSQRSRVELGCDVAVKLSLDGDGGRSEALLVMHLVERTRSLVRLRQFQPDLTISVKATDIAAVMKIAGELF